MEPRRHRRGDEVQVGHSFRALQLQWSHDVTVVEIVVSSGRTSSYASASMEPRRHRRGDAYDGITEGSRDVWASMEPRRHRRGDVLPFAACVFVFSSFNGATTSPSWRCAQALVGTISYQVLQWSHDVTVVEILIANPARLALAVASMEPRRHRRGDAAI